MPLTIELLPDQLGFLFFYVPGKHEGQVYIQTSEPFNPARDMAAKIGDINGNAVAPKRPQQMTWKPYLTSSPSRTPTVITKDLAVWNPLEYPFGRHLVTQYTCIYFLWMS